jgi:predicted nucleic acid-binding protein
LVKLLLNEPEAQEVRRLWVEAEAILTAAVTQVEAHAAIARRLPTRRAAFARSELAKRLGEMEIIIVDEALIATACDTADRYKLRALDALHLSAARCLLDPKLLVATWDGELRLAARRAGLAIAPA